MLTAYPSGVAAPTWLDLVNPTDAERASVETRYGLQLPTRAELSEIESSSRISEETGILYLSMPIVAHADALDQAPSPLGFVLSKDLLVTIRYTPLRSFEAAVAKLTKNGGRATSVETFATLIDEMVDMSADLLEGDFRGARRDLKRHFSKAAQRPAPSAQHVQRCLAPRPHRRRQHRRAAFPHTRYSAGPAAHRPLRLRAHPGLDQS
jgi:Mg2+ and Co2+ transporter CorA